MAAAGTVWVEMAAVVAAPAAVSVEAVRTEVTAVVVARMSAVTMGATAARRRPLAEAAPNVTLDDQ